MITNRKGEECVFLTAKITKIQDQQFKQLCRDMGLNAAQVIRMFVDGFVAGEYYVANEEEQDATDRLRTEDRNNETLHA